MEIAKFVAPMPQIQITRDVALPVAEAWARLTTWQRHADFVPLTSVRIMPNGFIAHTGIFGIGFDDPMEIVEWQPPHHCRLEKRGKLVEGWAEIRVEGEGEGARVRWTEEIRVRGVPTLFDPLVRLASRWMFSRLLDGLLAKLDELGEDGFVP